MPKTQKSVYSRYERKQRESGASNDRRQKERRGAEAEWGQAFNNLEQEQMNPRLRR